jgi:hypothetical protein
MGIMRRVELTHEKFTVDASRRSAFVITMMIARHPCSAGGTFLLDASPFDAPSYGAVALLPMTISEWRRSCPRADRDGALVALRHRSTGGQ